MQSSRLVYFYLFRHGETDWNAVGKFQGNTDIPINEKGQEQARALKPIMARVEPEVILSSDLSRAAQTAQIANEIIKAPHQIDPRLREANLGQAEGLTMQEIIAKFGEEVLSKWRSNHPADMERSYPGGETGRQVTERVMTALSEFALSTHASRVAVCTHGGVLRRILTTIAGDHLTFPIPNGVLYTLVFNRVTARWSWIPESDLHPPSENLIIARNGLFLSNGQEIEHESTRKVFWKNLFQETYTYRVRLGWEHARVHIEDTPLYVVSFVEEGDKVTFAFSDGTREVADLKRLRFEEPNRLLYFIKGREMEARFLPGAYHSYLLKFPLS